MNPTWVNAILDWRYTFLLARIGLTCAYWIGGFNKLFDFNGAVAEQAHFGIHPPVLFAILTIAVELIASALIILGRFVWLAAGALIVFTALATVIAHAFWTMQGMERFMAMNIFFEHIGLIAGLVMVAMLSGRERQPS
jgi:uncharacterized membrane protein YphA (DoxX/SURF4 family)